MTFLLAHKMLFLYCYWLPLIFGASRALLLIAQAAKQDIYQFPFVKDALRDDGPGARSWYRPKLTAIEVLVWLLLSATPFVNLALALAEPFATFLLVMRRARVLRA